MDIINATGIKAKLFKDDLEIGNISVEGGNVTLSVLDAGDYILEVISEVNSNYNSVCKYFNITILKAESRIYGPSIRSIYGDEIIVNLNSDEFVEIFDINNNLVKTSYSSLINSSDLGAGNYTLKIISPVDKNHVNASISDLIIFKANPFVGVVSKGGFVGESAKIDVNLAKNAKGNVSVNVNGQNYSSDVVNGHAVIFIPDLGVNKYDLEVVYSGDDNYNSTCNLTTFYINPVPFQVLYPKTCEIGEEINISVVFLKEIKCNFTVMIGNNCYFNRTVNESFIFSISDLTLGENKIDVSYSDETGSCYLNFTVFAKKVTLSESIFNFDSNDFKGVFVNLANDASGNLTVIVNNETLTKVLVNGGASVDVTGLSVGNYNLFVIYSGDDKYNSIIKNTTVTVKAIITSIVAPDISASYGVAKNLVITLKDVNGNKLVGKEVTVKVGTISKTLTSNNKGQISINIASLAPKTYKATIKFAGDSKYASVSKTVKVTVKKAPSKITAKKATFNAKKKTKKYSIILKVGKKSINKVKVTINVGKKTFTAKTNAKGKATFNLKKLTKKGNYVAVIKFKGNKNYKATSKKVKIIVK